MSAMLPVIFLVEDNPADAELLGIAFEDARRDVIIKNLRDGRQARAYLQTIVASGMSPALILLDINIPVVSGLQILQDIRSDSALQRIPTVILTSSDRPQDVEQASALKADAYLIKPRDFSGYGHVVAELGKYLDRADQVRYATQPA